MPFPPAYFIEYVQKFIVQLGYVSRVICRIPAWGPRDFIAIVFVVLISISTFSHHAEIGIPKILAAHRVFRT